MYVDSDRGDTLSKSGRRIGDTDIGCEGWCMYLTSLGAVTTKAGMGGTGGGGEGMDGLGGGER